jgi:hypothetical protein
MLKITSFVLGLFLLLGGVATALAQEKTEGMNQPPKILAISREFVKPGKAGMIHQKTEAAFVQAFNTAKWPTHYLAVTSMSGKPRALFLTGYDSFEAMEKDNKAVEQNASLTAALDRASLNDGELLSDFDQGVFIYREDLSLHSAVDIPHMRYFEISVFRVKPGHEKDFEALAKIYISAYDKVPDTHWAAYEVAYGSLGNTILLFSPMKTASEIDHNIMEGKQIEEAMGEDTMKKVRELVAASIESSQTNLFSFEPKMSYVSPEWAKADPAFWAPKTATAAPHKKAAETAKKQ